MKSYHYYTQNHTLPGRLLAFAAWLILIVSLLASALLSVMTGSFLLSIPGILTGFPLFFLLQNLAIKTENKLYAKKQTKNNDIAAKEAIDMQEDKKLLVHKCMEYLHKNLPDKMPSVGPCNPFFVCFDFPGTHNEAHLCVQCDASDTSQRRLITRIRRSGTDLCMMNYMMHGSMDEILVYLADKTNLAPLLESLQHLSDKMEHRD